MKTATPGKKIATLLFLCFISFSAVSCFAEQGDLPLQQVAERDTPLQSSQWKELTQQMVSLDIQGNLKEAVRIGENFQKLAIEKGEVNTKEYSELLMILGNYSINIGHIKKSEEQLKESLKIAHEINASPAYLANIEDDIARVHIFMLRCKEAKKFLALAGKDFRRASQTSGVVFSQYIQTTALLEKICCNDEKKALSLFEKALKITKESSARGKEIIEASILYNMADSYMEINNNEKAIKLLYKSLKIYKKINPKHPKTMFNYYLLGRIYTNIKDYKSAMVFYKKSLSIAKKTVDEKHDLISRIYAGMAALYFAFEEYDTAEDYFQKSINIRVYIYGKNTLKNAISFANLSYLYYLKKEYSKALEKSEFGLSLYKKNNYAPDKIYLDILDTRLMIFKKLDKSIEAQKCAELIKKYSKKTKK